MFLVFIVFAFNFCLIKANNENYTYGAETQYVNSLTDESKKAFIKNVAKRIISEVKEHPNNGTDEGKVVPNSELDKQNAFVANLLKEEAENLRRKNGDKDLNVTTIANSTDEKVTIGDGIQNDSASIEIEILPDKSGKGKIQEKDFKIPVAVVYDDNKINKSKIEIVFVKPKSRNDTAAKADQGIVSVANDSNNVSTIALNLNVTHEVTMTALNQSDSGNSTISKVEHSTAKIQPTNNPEGPKEILNGTRRSGDSVQPSLVETKALDLVSKKDTNKINSNSELKAESVLATETNENTATTAQSHVLALQPVKPSSDIPKNGETVALHVELAEQDSVKTEGKEITKSEVPNQEEKAGNIQVTEKSPIVQENKLELSTLIPSGLTDKGIIATSPSAVPYSETSDKASLPDLQIIQTSKEPPKQIVEKGDSKTVDLKPGNLNFESRANIDNIEQQEKIIGSSTLAPIIAGNLDKINTDTSTVQNEGKIKEISISALTSTAEVIKSSTYIVPIVQKEEMIKNSVTFATTKSIEGIIIKTSSTMLSEQIQEEVSLTTSKPTKVGVTSENIMSSTIAVEEKDFTLTPTVKSVKTTPAPTIMKKPKEEVSITVSTPTKSSTKVTDTVTDKDKKKSQITLKPVAKGIKISTETTTVASKEKNGKLITTASVSTISIHSSISSNTTDRTTNPERNEATTEAITSTIAKPEIHFKTREEKENKTKKSKQKKDKTLSIKEQIIEYKTMLNHSENKDSPTKNSSATVFKVKNSQIYWPTSTSKGIKITTETDPLKNHTAYEIKTKHIIWPESDNKKITTTEEIVKAVTSFITGYPNSKESGATESAAFLEKLKNSNSTQPPEFDVSIEEENKAVADKSESLQKSKGTIVEKLKKNEEIKKVAVKLGYKLTEVAPKKKKKEYNVYEIPDGQNPFEKINKGFGGNKNKKPENVITFFENFFLKPKRVSKDLLLNPSHKNTNDGNNFKIWKETKKVTVYDYDLPNHANENIKVKSQKKKIKEKNQGEYQSLLSRIKKTIAQKFANKEPNHVKPLKNFVKGDTTNKVSDRPSQDDINRFLFLVFGRENSETLRQKKISDSAEEIPDSADADHPYNFFLNTGLIGVDMYDAVNNVLNKLNYFGYVDKVGNVTNKSDDPFDAKEEKNRFKHKSKKNVTNEEIEITEQRMVNGTLQNVTIKVTTTSKPNLFFSKYIFRQGGNNKTFNGRNLDIRLVPMYVKLQKTAKKKNNDVNNFLKILKKLELNKRKGIETGRNDRDFIVIPNNINFANEYPEMKTKVVADDYYFGIRAKNEKKEKVFNDFDDIEVRRPSKTLTRTRKMETNALYDAYALKKLGWEHHDSPESKKKPTQSKRNKETYLENFDKLKYKQHSDGSNSDKVYLRSRVEPDEFQDASDSAEYHGKPEHMFWHESNREIISLTPSPNDKPESNIPVLRKIPRTAFMSSEEGSDRFVRELHTLGPVTSPPKTTKYNPFAHLIQKENAMLERALGSPRESRPQSEPLTALKNRNNLDGFLALNRQAFIPRSGGDVNIDIYVNVLTDMLGQDNRVLEKYDWLGTTVDIRSALNKLFSLCEDMRNNGTVHPKDFQLLKYMQYLYRAAKEELSVFQPSDDLLSKQNTQFDEDENISNEKIERAEIKQKPKKPVRLALSGKRHRITNLSKTWIQREGAIMGLDEFEDFFRGIERVLNNLHDAIKHIALITEFKRQRWYKNLKELYLTDPSRKKILEVILHLEFSKIIEKIESSSNKINNNYVKFAMNNKDLVEETKNEFVLLMEMYNQLKKYK